jgi:flagellar biosynthesis GTPase FlhF
MTTYKFLASDSASAMEEVVKKLGPDALIISTSRKGSKVEIEATNNFSDQQKQKDIQGNFSDVLHSKIDFLREKQKNRIYSRGSNDFRASDSRKSAINKNQSSEMVKVREQIKHLQNMLSGMVITDEKGLNEKTGSAVSLKLRKLEFAPEIVASLKPAYDGLNIDRGRGAFLKAFANKIACDEIEDIFQSDVIFIVGPSGAGKTTLSAKLAARMMEEDKDAKPTLVSAVSELANRRDDLAYYSKLLNIPKINYKIDENCSGFTSICLGQKIVDLSLIEEESKYFIQNVRDKIGATKVTTILCLSSGSSRQLLNNQINQYNNFKPIIAFTKADECQLFPRELCVLANKNVKMGFITGSKTILGSLALSEPDVLASHLESYITDELADE